MSIYQYQKVSDEFTTYTLELNQDQINQELCTIDGVTYHYVEGDLPTQFEQITVTETNLTPELRKSICQASRVCQLIDGNVVNKIRARYSVNDELKMLRIGAGAEFDAYNQFVEDCRAWGAQEKARFGL